jgi:hypothetical protein
MGNGKQVMDNGKQARGAYPFKALSASQVV